MQTRGTFYEFKKTIALATPMVIGQITGMSMGLVDAIMVGRELGTEALAALGFAVNLTFLFGLAGFGIANSVSVLVARATGGDAQRGDPAGDYPRIGALLGFIYGLGTVSLVTATLLLAPRFGFYGQPPIVVGMGATYGVIYALAVATMHTAAPLRSTLEARNKPWIPLAVLTVAVGLNILLNWIFIFGRLGVPAMGLTGAGLASLIANLFALVTLYGLLRRGGLIGVRGARSFRWPLGPFRSLLRIGVPVSVQISLEGGSFIFAAILMGWLGAVSLAAHHIAIQVASVTFMLPMGISFALAIRVGHAAGSQDGESVRRICDSALRILICSGLIAATVLASLSGWIPTLFSRDPMVIELAAALLFLAAIFQIFDQIQVGEMGILRGLEDVRVPTLMTLVGYWVIAMPVGAALAFATPLGARGIWIGFIIGLALAAIGLMARTRFIRRNLFPQAS